MRPVPQDTFSDPLLRSLRDHDVDFVVIGGHAVCHHGFIRTTEDLDVVVDPTAVNRKRLHAMLMAVGASWLSNEKDSATGLWREVPVSWPYVEATPLMMLCTSHGPLDVFTYIPGFPEVAVEDIFSTASTWQGVKYVSLPWLVKMKRKAGRPRDIEDIEQLQDARDEERGICQ